MKTIKVKLSQYNLNADQLSNLASEFYGKVLETMTDQYEIKFDAVEPEGSYNGDTEKSLTLQFIHALNNFAR